MCSWPPSTRLLLPVGLLLASAASGAQASGGGAPEIRIYGAYVAQGEYGAVIADQACLLNGIGIEIAPALRGGRFDRVLRYGEGRLGPVEKYVVVDALVRVPGGVTLEDLPRGQSVTLVWVYRMREVLYDPGRVEAEWDSRENCQRDETYVRAWRLGLQRREPAPRRRAASPLG
jgi:hypothetical protein